jgi:acyl-CoA thioester hydrolase
VRSHSIVLQVPFHDVDPMEVAWHGHYVKYFELARCALLDTIGYGYSQMRASGYAWPVVDLKIRYVRPAWFEQRIRVTATLMEWDVRLRIDYVIEDEKTGERLTKGSSVQVAVDLKTREALYASPPILFERLGLPVP